MLSHSVEDYLKAIYELEEDFGLVTTSLLAVHLDVRPASVTGWSHTARSGRPSVSAQIRAAVPPTRRTRDHPSRVVARGRPAMMSRRLSPA